MGLTTLKQILDGQPEGSTGLIAEGNRDVFLHSLDDNNTGTYRSAAVTYGKIYEDIYSRIKAALEAEGWGPSSGGGGMGIQIDSTKPIVRVVEREYLNRSVMGVQSGTDTISFTDKSALVCMYYGIGPSGDKRCTAFNINLNYGSANLFTLNANSISGRLFIVHNGYGQAATAVFPNDSQYVHSIFNYAYPLIFNAGDSLDISWQVQTHDTTGSLKLNYIAVPIL